MRLIKIILALVLLAVVISFAYSYIEKKVTRIELPKGELNWTNIRPKNAKMCIPAAFTDKDGRISGSYKYNGKTHQNGKALNMRASLKGDSFYISKNWLSDNGFQQLTLVYNSKAMRFSDSHRAIRRALCKDENVAFLLESNYPMTMNTFAEECSKHSTNATYLDMGEYGYGYVKKNHLIRPLHIWGFFARDKQTNWIYIE